MISVSDLLASVVCGKCETSLMQQCEEDGLIKYKCFCTEKIRTLLNCEYCKKPFLNFPYLVRKTNYCSLECYWIGTRRAQLRICKICHKEFNAKAPLIKKGFGFYCSMDCWFGLFKKQRISLKCKQCGKIFDVPKSVFRKNPSFCSKACSDTSKRDYVSRICKKCKTKFEIPRSIINRSKGYFCSWNCYHTYDGETSIERLVRLKLQKLKEPFKQEMKIGRYHADFYLPNRNLIIECDGEYWHRNKIEHDQRRDEILKNLGYKILRLSEENIKKKQVDIMELISF